MLLLGELVVVLLLDPLLFWLRDTFSMGAANTAYVVVHASNPSANFLSFIMKNLKKSK
jgi:hypothetical protein